MSRETNNRAKRLVNKVSKPIVSVGTSEMILPNNSGDHVRSIKRNDPVDNMDLVNKKYVDTEIDTDIATHIGTAQAHSDYMLNTGDTSTGNYTFNNKLTIEKDTGGTYDATTVSFIAGDTDADDNIYLIGNTINTGFGQDNNASLWINYRGYNGGVTQYRDFYIGDGKGNSIIKFDGSDGNVGIGTTDTSLGKLTLAKPNTTAILALVRTDATISNGTPLGAVWMYGTDGGNHLGSGMRGGATGKWTATNSQGELQFFTTPANSITTTKRMTIEDDGNVTIENGKLTIEKDTGTVYDATTISFLAGDTDSFDSVYMQGQCIGVGLNYNENSALWLNYHGYHGAVAQFRDINFGDGKGNKIIFLDGSANATEFYGDIIFSGAGSGLPYGEIYVHGNTTGQTISTATSTQVTTFDTNGESNLTTPDHTNDHITITKTGKYLINVSSAFSGDPNVTWSGGVYKNNGATQLANIQTERKLGAGGDVGSVSISGIASLTADDTIEVWFQHAEGVDKSITVKELTLSVSMVGG